MNKQISVCGTDCSKCSYFEQKTCGGCGELKGVVFHCSDGQACSIYSCCVSKCGHSNCLECSAIPCEIWKKTRDPKFSDSEFDENIRRRIQLLQDNR